LRAGWLVHDLKFGSNPTIFLHTTRKLFFFRKGHFLPLIDFDVL